MSKSKMKQTRGRKHNMSWKLGPRSPDGTRPLMRLRTSSPRPRRPPPWDGEPWVEDWNKHERHIKDEKSYPQPYMEPHLRPASALQAESAKMQDRIDQLTAELEAAKHNAHEALDHLSRSMWQEKSLRDEKKFLCEENATLREELASLRKKGAVSPSKSTKSPVKSLKPTAAAAAKDTAASGAGPIIDCHSAEAVFAQLRPQADSGPLTPVRLLDSDWLLRRAQQIQNATNDEERRSLALPYRQELEVRHPEAFITEEVIRELPSVGPPDNEGAAGDGVELAIAVGAVSHAWATPNHPDPLGENIARLAEIIRVAQNGELPRQSPRYGDEHFEDPQQHYMKLAPRLGIFYDWCSLHQKDAQGQRTVDEKKAFSWALDRMQIWYAHAKLCAFLLTCAPDTPSTTFLPYHQRGWPTVERAWTMLAKTNNYRCWPMIYDSSSRGEALRTPPMHPDRLDRLLRQKTFTNDADKELVTRLYRKTAEIVLGEATVLNYNRNDWCGQHFVALAEMLPMCNSLNTFQLFANRGGDVGAEVLAYAALEAGVLPNLRVLGLNLNEISSHGCSQLVKALCTSAEVLPRLEQLLLVYNNCDKALALELKDDLKKARPGIQVEFSV